MPHPHTPARSVRSLDVALGFDDAGALRLEYRLTAELRALRVPAAAAAARRDGLWRHTCFEVFFAPDQGVGYREFNFSPSGDWAAYDFRAPREGMVPSDLSRPPRIDRAERGDELRLSASIAAADLRSAGTLRVGLTAVIEDASGARAYFALAHPRAEPDFHDPGGFTLRLPGR